MPMNKSLKHGYSGGIYATFTFIITREIKENENNVTPNSIKYIRKYRLHQFDHCHFIQAQIC